MEAPAPNVSTDCEVEVKSHPDHALPLEPARDGGDDHFSRDDAVKLEASTVIANPGASGVAAKPANKASKTFRSRGSSTASQEATDLAEQAATAAKRNLRLNTSSSHTRTKNGQEGTPDQLTRSMIHLAPNKPKKDRRKTSLETWTVLLGASPFRNLALFLPLRHGLPVTLYIL